MTVIDLLLVAGSGITSVEDTSASTITLSSAVTGSAILTATTGSVVKHDVSAVTAGSYSAVIVDTYGHVIDGSTTAVGLSTIAGSAIMSDTTGSVVKHNTVSVTAGSYTKVQIDAYGHIVGGSQTAAGGALTEIVQDTTPQLGGNLDMNQNNIQMSIPTAVDETSSGLIYKDAIVDTNAQGIGAPLFIAADGHFDTATGSEITAPCVALALESGSGIKDILMLGGIQQDTWTWTIGPGTQSLIYISGSLGTLTQTIPTLVDQMIQPVGFAITGSYMWFNPSLLYATATG